MTIRKLLPVILLMLPVLAACSSNPPMPTPSPTAQGTPEPLSPDEEAALHAARAFLVAWEARDASALTALLSGRWLEGSGREWVETFGGTVTLKAIGLRIDRSRPAAPGAVLFGVELEVTPAGANTPWNSGVNSRVIQVEREGGTWKVAGVGG